MVVGTRLSRFKSEVLCELGAITPKFGQLYRLVKAWAKPRGVNEPGKGSFNSFSLSLLVIFHLQNTSPPLLPPLCELLHGFECDTEDSFQNQDELDRVLLDVRARCAAWRAMQDTHLSPLEPGSPFDLLFTFFWRLEQMLGANKGTNFSVSVSKGRLVRREFTKSSLFQIEDPFCEMENTARTITEESVAHLLWDHAYESLLLMAGCYASNDAENLFLGGVLRMEFKEGARFELGEDSPWSQGERWRNYFSQIMPRSHIVRAPPAWPRKNEGQWRIHPSALELQTALANHHQPTFWGYNCMQLIDKDLPAEAAPEEEGEGGEVDASGLREEDIEWRISFLRSALGALGALKK